MLRIKCTIRASMLCAGLIIPTNYAMAPLVFRFAHFRTIASKYQLVALLACWLVNHHHHHNHTKPQILHRSTRARACECVHSFGVYVLAAQNNGQLGKSRVLVRARNECTRHAVPAIVSRNGLAFGHRHHLPASIALWCTFE